MPYNDFTLDSIELKLGILNHVQLLFENVPKIEPSQWLKIVWKSRKNCQ